MARPPRPSRVFYADALLSGRVSLDGYPFRYIVVTPSPGSVTKLAFSFGTQTNPTIDAIFTAVEMLESRGWELVGFDQNGLAAFMRRH
jgi:hypothetical protein